MEELPFRSVSAYPSAMTAGGALARLVDGIGFRFHWATEKLREADYSFSPGADCKTIGELVEHIWGLVHVVHESVGGAKQACPRAPAEQRRAALVLMVTLRERLAAMGDEELAAVEIVEHPVWHVINGPLADALTHVGQINSFRRLAGNPPLGASVFACQPPRGM